MKSAVEEVLRFESSNQLGNRITDRGNDARRYRSCRRARWSPSASAPPTAIPDAFPDPDRFDVARNPTRHLAFGSGIHMCAGMSLARLEGRVAIERFLARFPGYEPDGAPTRSRRARFRGFTRAAGAAALTCVAPHENLGGIP